MRVIVIDDFLMDDNLDLKDLNGRMDIIEMREQVESVIVRTQYPVSMWHERIHSLFVPRSHKTISQMDCIFYEIQLYYD